MGITTFLKDELLEIIEWQDDTRDTLCFRYPDEDKAIKRGAQLIVRESQVAQFVYLGEFGDTFGPGKHRLVTDNIPILTRLKSWRGWCLLLRCQLSRDVVRAVRSLDK